ncbi:syntaxin 1B/2/3 [Fusarium oxysporum f. sp. pisi HDV247]|uniref:Syntaxin 1B/2/3 n=2 Tax=Fusarium oxysporum f. sp. pisi HDV247 TaxID=1080344 RepID=W9Q3F0_FUSOX|nr:syntaxin 1B/2/3 [Fusarium oxysporum f. sp. pisi HDV247]
MSYGYGGQNPYDSPDQGYGGNNGYGNGGGYNSPPAQGYGGSVEMAPLAHNAGGFGQGDPNAILNECRDIDRGIDTVEQNLEQLRMIQQRTLDDADSSGSSAASRQLDSLSADTMSLYRELTERVRTVKSNPEAKSPKNNPHVTRIDRRLKAAITQYQQVESQFRKRTQDQMARQYRIVRPDASEQEIQAAVEDTTGGQVFSQAMMQSDRQGRARAALSAVQDRHQALIKIEQQMVELAQLFQDMDTLVVQQEAAVTQIEQKGEEVVENLDKGNEEIGVAVNTARKTRKKKWICLGICGMYLRPQLDVRHLTNLSSCYHCCYCHYCSHLHLRHQGTEQQQQEAKYRGSHWQLARYAHSCPTCSLSPSCCCRQHSILSAQQCWRRAVPSTSATAELDRSRTMREWLGGDCLRMTTRRYLYSLRNIYALQRSGPGSCGGKSSVRAVFVFCVFPLDLDHNCCYSPIARLFSLC